MYLTERLRNCKVRISREGEQIFEGELASLKRFKDDVKEVLLPDMNVVLYLKDLMISR